jgi:hypothetical protein
MCAVDSVIVVNDQCRVTRAMCRYQNGRLGQDLDGRDIHSGHAIAAIVGVRGVSTQGSPVMPGQDGCCPKS